MIKSMKTKLTMIMMNSWKLEVVMNNLICTVCEMENDHETWECPLVENVSRTEAPKRRIKQARVMYKSKIRAKYFQTKTNKNS